MAVLSAMMLGTASESGKQYATATMRDGTTGPGTVSGAGAGAATEVLAKGKSIRIPAETILTFKLAAAGLPPSAGSGGAHI